MSACRALRRPVPRRRTTLPAVFAAVAAMALTACGSGDNPKSGGQTQFVQGAGGVSVVKDASTRQDAPDLDGKTLDGKALDVGKEYKGKIVVLNVWGSWCSPCRAEAKNLVTVAKDYKSKGVEFVGLNTRDTDPAPAIKFEKEFEVPYPSFYDSAGELLLRFPKGSLNPQFIPSTVFIDRDGKIAARAVKALSEDELRKTLDPLVAEK
ncbi:TlpA family protein disulfide reductase [Streptomyces albireticuli]|uniref:Redoxin domain-containing protein n=1 Tax=Streptomyces albireticuli TaxID=1940 RepID=A0A2A2DDT1_9ACTN|nr:TlpA disulfide reductase family protein [Streptomyces albireticuli]MCD9144839.1 TlpA family protein disulfide reductase [Streptomyces albireticuli]MCD9165708.1 TlpA family protein disulfide reductase [Streptomyces albireticuli]MCD9193746.1 TlpA family protein disulfide reductase [Streptomyces albireticuli]PAU49684.1 redoxin domain-containing protein [Streptomyces albireticuli]